MEWKVSYRNTAAISHFHFELTRCAPRRVLRDELSHLQMSSDSQLAWHHWNSTYETGSPLIQTAMKMRFLIVSNPTYWWIRVNKSRQGHSEKSTWIEYYTTQGFPANWKTHSQIDDWFPGLLIDCCLPLSHCCFLYEVGMQLVPGSDQCCN